MSTRKLLAGAATLMGAGAVAFATVGAGAATANTCTTTQSTLAGIDGAVSNAQPGDIICITGGNYGFLGLSGPATGTPFSTITLRNVPGQTVTFTGIGVANVSYLTIMGVGLTPGGQLQVDNNDTGISYQPTAT